MDILSLMVIHLSHNPKMKQNKSLSCVFFREYFSQS